ncbi:hypothetical protein BKA67DRAFT_377327 [Truncatella angustata]|uniref:Transcription factor domain-containing protein n=1 Tax=Truncatella angustata TaxID=152316 RepID=A0A9P8UFB1_9PEZI|nr:uncharacterized protein BKA67DRAFT_377327 [Truncatella angustata]KAH6648930.1 hypothetical protein BKA67DRAFT_377327 [Truncatella angustata]
MLLSFPFVPIPPYRANQANRESPALLSAILYTCRFELSSVTGDSDKSFREYFARQSVVNDEKSLDLLQAILLFLAWDDWQSVATARDTSLMHLSLGLVGDLGLNRPPLSQTVPVGSCSIANQSNVKIKGFNVRKEHSNAEKRALLGVFYITSVLLPTSSVWTLFRRTEPPEYTNYMEQCCNDLTEAREYVTDSIVVALVRMQSLIVQIAKAFPHPSLRSHVFPTVPLSLYFSTIQFQLKDILRQVPEAQRLNYLILSHEHTVLLRLYEPVIHMDSLQSIDHSISKTDVLWSCCQEAKTFFEMWLRLPAGVYSATPCALFAHIAFANLTLTQLLFADDRHWNSQIAREHVDYPVIVRRLIDHIEIYRKQSGQDFGGVEGNFSHPQCYVEKWRYAINWYYAKLNSKYPASATIPASETLLPLVGDDDELWQTMFAFENEMMY